MKAFSIFSSLLFVFLHWGCQSPDSCPGLKTEPWLPGFFSGMELQAAKDTLLAIKYTSGPPIEGGVEEILTVLDYYHLGSFGVLKLFFFEKRLTRARFIPDNADLYGNNFDAWLPEARQLYEDTETIKLKDAMTAQRYIEWRSRCRTAAFSEWVAKESLK